MKRWFLKMNVWFNFNTYVLTNVNLENLNPIWLFGNFLLKLALQEQMKT